MTLMEVEARLAALEAEVARLKQQLDSRDGEDDAAAAFNRGLEQIERGEGVPAIAFVKELGRKYGIDNT
jgi:hypothetical protein